MADTFIFSKPMTFLACPGMSEVRSGMEALDSPPGYILWLENEEIIRWCHVPDFVEQSRAALEAVRPGTAALVDAMADEIRTSSTIIASMQSLDLESAAAAFSYCYWRYCADVVGRSQGIPHSAIERQFDRAAASLDGIHKVQWACPCCDGQARYQVDGLTNHRSARRGGFSVDCPRCGHRERLYGGFMYEGRLECRCPVCVRFLQTLAGQLTRPARKLLASLSEYAWQHAIDTVAELREVKEESFQRLTNGALPSENAVKFAMAAQSNDGAPLSDILCQLDPTIEGRLDKNPRAWALLCELLREGVVDVDSTIYDEDGCQEVALEVSVLEDTGGTEIGAAQDHFDALLRGYDPAFLDTFMRWMHVLKQTQLCNGRFNAAVDVEWRPNADRCRILAERRAVAKILDPYTNVSQPRRQVGQRSESLAVYLSDAELDAVILLRSRGYLVLSPEDLGLQQANIKA